MWITSYWKKLLTRDGSSPYILQHSNSCRFPQDTYIWRSCLVRFMRIYQGIHVVLHLKLLVPPNHMSSQYLAESSQYVLSSRHMSLKILSRMVHVHLSSYSCGLHLKLLQPTNHISLSRSWCIVSICRILKTRHRFCPSRPHCSVRRWLHLLPCSAQPFWLLNCRERMTTQYIRTIDNLFPPELSVATAHPNRVNILNTTIAVFTFLSGCTTP